MLIIVFFGFIFLQIFIYMTHKDVNRSATSLLNQYYRLKNSDPLAAKKALEILIKQYPHNQTALRELAFWYLNQGDVRTSIAQFEIAYHNDESDTVTAMELSRLYTIVNQPAKAQEILSKLTNNRAQMAVQKNNISNQSFIQPFTLPIKITAQNSSTHLLISIPSSEKNTTETVQAILNNIPQPYPRLTMIGKNEKHEAIVSKTQQQTSTLVANQVSDRDKMMNEFYDLKRNKSSLAWNKINQIVNKYPYDIQALKEAGYYALITLKSDQLAEKYFLRVYQLTNDPKIALQLGYIYDNLQEKRTAYYYFDLATNTSDLKDRMTAELAKSNLSGVQTKFLPYPYYASLDYSPLYMSRFKLLIHPIIARFGVELNKQFNWRAYLSYRRTSDDKSSTSNQISNIYEDNIAITALGTQLTPLPFVPQLILFSELGKSVDLVYRDRSRWRSDFRGGLAYYNEWGRPVDYTLHLKYMLQPNADIYGDAIYYNRYHDGIATLRIRPGLKVVRYGSASIDLYYRIFVVEDQARQFYNNILELGPGIALRFSDRYNIVLRYEVIHGRYLPASSPSPNPYSKNYHNGITELNTYFEF